VVVKERALTISKTQLVFVSRELALPISTQGTVVLFAIPTSSQVAPESYFSADQRLH